MAIGSRAALVLGAAALLVLAVRTVSALAAIALSERGTPLWDPAAHGYAGIELANAIRHFDLLGFLAGLNRQVTWPFLHSLALCPAFLIFGDRYETGDLVSTFLYTATLANLFLIAFMLRPPGRGFGTGALLVILMLLSPAALFFGTVTMLEIPGAFLLTLAILLLARAERGSRERDFRVAAYITSTALFFCKYNYGLLWLVPMVLHEALASGLKWREALASAARALRLGARRHPLFSGFLVIYGAILAGIFVTGGGVVRVLGVSISLRTPWHLAYYLYLILVVRWLLSLRKRPAAFREAWRRIPERIRLLGTTVGLPIAVWFLIPYPNRVRAFFRFLLNRDEGAPAWSFERVAYYPKAFLNEYSAHPILGAILLVLALIPPQRGDRSGIGRLTYLALGVGLAATAIHGYENPRFFFLTAFLVWIRAAQSAAFLAERAIRALPSRGGLREAAWAASLAILLGGGWLLAPDPDRTRAAHRAFETPAAFENVLSLIEVQTGGAGARPVLLGYSNRLSPPLLAWHASRAHPPIPESRLPERLPALPPETPESVLRTRAELLRTRGVRVVSALPDPGSPLRNEEYRRETEADSALAAVMLSSGTWVLERETRVPGIGMRVISMRPLVP